MSCDVFSVLQATISKQQSREENGGLGSICPRAASCAGEEVPVAGWREEKNSIAGNEAAKWIPCNEMALLSVPGEVNHLVVLLVFSDSWLHLLSVTQARSVLRTRKALGCKGVPAIEQSQCEMQSRAEAA